MGRLGKLASFVVIRLGLFVTLTAFVIGQFWQISVQRPIAGDLFQVRFSRHGWSALKGQQRLNSTPQLNASIADAQSAPPDWRFGESLIGPDGEPLPETWFESKRIFPGVILAKLDMNAAQSVAVRHWLLLSFFSVTYMLLKLVYRHPPDHAIDDVQSADEIEPPSATNPERIK